MLADEIASERVTNRLALTAEAFAIFFCLALPFFPFHFLRKERVELIIRYVYVKVWIQ